MSALTEAMHTYWWLLPLPFIAAVCVCGPLIAQDRWRR